jgi:hypothetical protein
LKLKPSPPSFSLDLKEAKHHGLRFAAVTRVQVIVPKNSELAVWRFKQLNFQNGSILCPCSRVKADVRKNRNGEDKPRRITCLTYCFKGAYY